MDGYKADEPFHAAGAGRNWPEPFQAFAPLGHGWLGIGSGTLPPMHNPQQYMRTSQDCQFAPDHGQALLDHARGGIGGYPHQHTDFIRPSHPVDHPLHHPAHHLAHHPSQLSVHFPQQQHPSYQFLQHGETTSNMRMDLIPPEDDDRSRLDINVDHQLALRISSTSQCSEAQDRSPNSLQLVALQPQAVPRVLARRHLSGEELHVASAPDRAEDAADARANSRKRQRTLAPRPDDMGPTDTNISQQSSSKRSHQIKDPDKTARIRKVRGCIPCRSKRVSCDVGEYSEGGPCKSCNKKSAKAGGPHSPEGARIITLCYRQTVGDLVMNRNSNGSRWEHRHPLTGKFYGNFCRPKEWYGEPKTVYLTRIVKDKLGIPFVVQDFNFQNPEFFIDSTNPLKNNEWDNKLYKYRFAMRDPIRAKGDICTYLQSPSYIFTVVEHTMKCRIDHTQTLSTRPRLADIYRLCFHSALKWAFGKSAKQSRLLQGTLYFWVASRFLDGDLVLQGGEALGWENQRGLPFGLLNQFQSLLMNDILPTYRSEVSRILTEKISVRKDGRKENWLEVFLAVFILLTCVEMNLQHEADWASRDKCETEFVSSGLIKQFLQDATNILLHFHVHFNGGEPMRKLTREGVHGLLSHIGQVQQMPGYHPFLTNLAALVQDPTDRRELMSACLRGKYHAWYFFVGQLFIEDWQPSQEPFVNRRVNRIGPQEKLTSPTCISVH